MYKIILTLILVSFPSTLFAQPRVTTLRARRYIPLKSEYRQLRISPLPTKNSQIDAKAIIINSALFNKNEVQYLNRSQRASFNRTVKAITLNKLEDANSTWKDLVKNLTGSVPIDINALIQQVLRESYLETTQELLFYASKVKFYNELKRNIRDTLTQMRDLTTNFDGSSSSETKEDLEKMIEKLEVDLKKAEEEEEAASSDLTRKLLRNRRFMEQISRTSKMLHDTATAVIRKIG